MADLVTAMSKLEPRQLYSSTLCEHTRLHTFTHRRTHSPLVVVLQLVKGMKDWRVAVVGCGGRHTVAIDTGGNVFSWGVASTVRANSPATLHSWLADSDSLRMPCQFTGCLGPRWLLEREGPV